MKPRHPAPLNALRTFEAAARRWPAHTDADAARYRAALAWERAGKPEQSARVLESFVADRPNAELARDARLLVARQYETLRDTARVAGAYLAFAKVERDDASASAARLRAADAFEATGRIATADSLRLDHVRRHPSDVDGAFTVKNVPVGDRAVGRQINTAGDCPFHRDE